VFDKIIRSILVGHYIFMGQRAVHDDYFIEVGFSWCFSGSTGWIAFFYYNN